MNTRKTLGELARVMRSKNAGPYITTVDVFFRDAADFARARGAHILTPELVASRYGIPEADVLGVYFYEPALAVKVSFLKPVDSGDPFSPDISGASQHVPLIDVEL